MRDSLDQISRILLQSQGLDISKYEAAFLNRSLQDRISATRCESEDAYCEYLERNSHERELILRTLRNSYSEFFRNPLTFSVLERIVLPSMILKKQSSKDKEIRIWSSACAAGQEAYSLAMLMEELKKGGGYRIFATDQCEAQIDEARRGSYSDSSLNNLNMKRMKQWFTKQGDTYTVKPELKKSIDFSVFDLLNEDLRAPPTSIFGDFDLVVCANLLFYYKREYQLAIIEKVVNCMANNAYLVVGETEREIIMRREYRELFPQSGIFEK